MLAEFSIVPIGVGDSLSAKIAHVVEIVEKSDLQYRLNPMGTVIEGEWKEVMSVIEKCHVAVLDECSRVVTSIRIDDRPGTTDMITHKIESVEEKLGKKVHK
jgi:uncharacterized protein (TIGR00106 family)